MRKKLNSTKFIFVTGGVVSSLGKGITVSSLGAMLKARGYSVFLKKLDPYLNVDPSNMNPIQHGEVFVTNDGSETDLDLGHYERFVGIETTKNSNITSGRAYLSLLNQERMGKYLGSTVQVVPHLTNLIQDFIRIDSEEYDFVLCEIGGTVGDIESAPFLEAIRQFSKVSGDRNSAFIHVTLLPYIASTQELKTKPTQHSVKTLMSFGIEPDIIVCRTDVPLSDSEKNKISLFCNVDKSNVIEAMTLKSVYEAPLVYSLEKFDSSVLSLFGINDKSNSNYLSHWTNFMNKMNNATEKVKIAIVGKYQSFDSYKSLVEALQHACVQNDLVLELDLLFSGDVEKNTEVLSGYQAIVVPGGFGVGQTDGKLAAINFARINKIPFLGICFGMQLAVIEFCRNVLGMKNVSSKEFDENLSDENAIIDTIEEFKNSDETIAYKRSNSAFAGKMNIGASDVKITKNSLAWDLYKEDVISERHRHRFQVLIKDHSLLSERGGVFSGSSVHFKLPSIFELDRGDYKDLKNYHKNKNNIDSATGSGHPFFIGVQFHPELKSSPFKPVPLFDGLIQAAKMFDKKN